MSCRRYVMYLRKSSESEERQKASIPAQERELLEFAGRRGIQVAGERFRETMSAKRPGRPQFEQMLRQLEKKTAEGILCWHLDRLARNPLDGGRIMQALGDGVIQEILTPGRSYTSADDKLMMAIEFGMSTKYVDDLARNIARGRRESLGCGRWPGPPKVGYVRDRNLNTLVPDPERFGLVRQLWRWKLEGVALLEIVRRAREELHLTTPRRGRMGGGALSPSRVYDLLHDPFYAGVMRFKRETFAGTHEPMVSWSEFEKVQALIAPTTPRPIKHRFPYGGLINCGACKAIVTAEFTVNRYGTKYTYYHCCRKSRNYGFCPQRSIEERELEHQLLTYLSGLTLPQKFLDKVLEMLPAVINGLDAGQAEAAARRAKLLTEKERQLERLRLLCVDEVISREEYIRDRERIQAEMRRLDEEQHAPQDGVPRLIEPLRNAVSFVNQAVFRFREGSPADRRAIVEMVSSNLFLKDRTVLIEAKKPFAFLSELRTIPELCTRQEDVRTYLERMVNAYLELDAG